MRRNPALLLAGLLVAVAAATAYVAISHARTREHASAPQPSPPAAAVKEASADFSAEQLDNLVAPIALYPDSLLGQVLVACTYPLEIVEAQQWLQRNDDLHDAALLDAARQQKWDASVQALVIFPDVLARLNQDTRWTTDLGNAYLAQPADVMAAVQRMRSRAESAGKLASTDEQKVITRKDEWNVVIEIQPADPQVLYVPAYNPVYIWGPAVWGYYPALVYTGVGFVFEPAIPVGIYFDGWPGWAAWGWYPDWYADAVFVNPPFFTDYGFDPVFGGFAGPGAWMHNPVHRMGVPYANNAVARQFHAPAGAQGGQAKPAGGAAGQRTNTAAPAANRTGAAAPAANRAMNSRGGGARTNSPAPTANRTGAAAPAANRAMSSQGGGAATRSQGAMRNFSSSPSQAGMARSSAAGRTSMAGTAGTRTGASSFGAQRSQSMQRFGTGSAARTAPRAASAQYASRPSMQNYRSGSASPRSVGSAQRSFGSSMARSSGGAGRSFGRRR